MSVYTPTADPSQLTQLRADITQLTSPIHRPPIPQRTRQAGRRRRGWTALQPLPPLLDQLRQAARYPGTAIRGPERHPVPSSKPPGNLDAMATLAGLYVALSWWHATLQLPSPPRESDWQHTALRQLADHARQLDPATVQRIAVDVHQWWRDAAHHAGLTTTELLALR